MADRASEKFNAFHWCGFHVLVPISDLVLCATAPVITATLNCLLWALRSYLPVERRVHVGVRDGMCWSCHTVQHSCLTRQYTASPVVFQHSDAVKCAICAIVLLHGGTMRPLFFDCSAPHRRTFFGRIAAQVSADDISSAADKHIHTYYGATKPGERYSTSEA